MFSACYRTPNLFSSSSSPRTRSWKSIANSKPVIMGADVGLFSSCCIILCLSKPNFQLSFSHLVSVCRFFSDVLQSALFTVQNQLVHQRCHLTFVVLLDHSYCFPVLLRQLKREKSLITVNTSALSAFAPSGSIELMKDLTLGFRCQGVSFES